MVGKRTAVKAPAPAFGDGPPRGRRNHDPYHHGGHQGQTNPVRMDETIHWSTFGAPWVVAFVIIPFVMICTRLLFGYNRATLALGVALLLASGSWLAHVVNDEAAPRKRWTRVRVTITVLWIFLVLAVHLVLTGGVLYQLGGGTPGLFPIFYAGPDAWWRIDLRILGAEIFTGAVLALWWTLGALPAVKGDGNDAHAAGEDTLAHALGIGTTGPRAATKVDGPRRLVPLKLRGATIDGIRQASDLIAVAAGVGRNNVRIEEDPDDASNVDLVMMEYDVLRKMPPPPPPSHPGGSVTDPCNIGLREDNSYVLTLRVNHDGGRHVLTGGMTNGGKTEAWINGELFELSTRIDVVFLHSDTRKLGATMPDIAPVIARVASTESGTKKMVIGLQAVIKYRMDHVGRCWTPESRDHLGNRMPAIGVTFEEISEVANYLGTALRVFVETARTAGIFVKISLQRAEGSILDTNARAQFAEGECFPVRTDEDAAMVLNEETVMAGARPEIWGPRLQDGYAGYFYRECGPFQKFSMPARSWHRSPAAIREHVGTWSPRMAWGQGPEGLDAGSAEAMGAAWTDLTSGPDYAVAHGWTREVVETEGAPQVLWIPPRELGDTRTEAERVTVTATVNGGQPVTTTQTTPASEPEDETEDDEGDPMFQSDVDAVRAEVDRELADALAEDDEIGPDQPETGPDLTGEDVEDLDLEAGSPLPDGGSLSWPDKVRAAADVLDQMTAGVTRTIRTADIQDLWYETPGVTQAVRPSLTRILNLLVDRGEGSDAGRGKWSIEPTAGGFLRAHIGDLADEEDEEDDA